MSRSLTLRDVTEAIRMIDRATKHSAEPEFQHRMEALHAAICRDLGIDVGSFDHFALPADEQHRTELSAETEELFRSFQDWLERLSSCAVGSPG